MQLISNYFYNPLNKFQEVSSDFTGVSLNPEGILLFLKSLIITLAIFILMYFFGDKIRSLFFQEYKNKTENIFINIAFGYITIGTFIAILGIFSLFSLEVLFSFLILIICFSIVPLNNFILNFTYIILEVKKVLFKIPKSWINIFVFLFVLIAFLRLILPETGVDAVWYHIPYPREYLSNQTLMIKPAGSFLYQTAIPQLGQMFYVVTEFFTAEQGARISHFLFYILVILLLYYFGTIGKFKKVVVFAPLLFVTAPVIIRHSSTAYTDFQWIFLWLLSFLFLIKDKKNTKDLILSSIFLGGVFATKPQALAFFPAFLILVLLNKYKFLNLIKFLIISISIPSIWYLRSYFLTGSFLHPAVEKTNDVLSIINLFQTLSINSILLRFLNFTNIFGLSVLSIIGLIFLFNRKKQIKELIKSPSFLFPVIVYLEYFFLSPVYLLARHLLYFYSVFILFLSSGIYNFYLTYKRVNIIIPLSVFFIFIYYFFSTIIILPYGFGWANQNKYLTRILEKDNSSYYDFDYKFSKYITSTDLVGTYGISGFYYADFNHLDIESVYTDNKIKSLSALRQKGITKLLTKRDNINLMCKRLKITDCNLEKYQFLSNHQEALQYLYYLK